MKNQCAVIQNCGTHFNLVSAKSYLYLNDRPLATESDARALAASLGVTVERVTSSDIDAGELATVPGYDC